MIYKSFNDWSSLGYKINKGAKAHWIDNKPMFSNLQVTKTVKPTKHYYNHWEYNVPKGNWDHWGHEASYEDFY